MGAAQFDYLRAEGLKPEHRLLDIGCGTLRGGVIDISQEMLDAGEQELALAGISNRRHTLRQTSEFDMRFADTQFDYALAQSVFTHIDLNQILRCVLNVQRVLAPAGRFYATFLETPRARTAWTPFGIRSQMSPTPSPSSIEIPSTTASMRSSVHAAEPSSRVDYIGDWGSPRGQKMLLFRRAGPDQAAITMPA